MDSNPNFRNKQFLSFSQKNGYYSKQSDAKNLLIYLISRPGTPKSSLTSLIRSIISNPMSTLFLAWFGLLMWLSLSLGSKDGRPATKTNLNFRNFQILKWKQQLTWDTIIAVSENFNPITIMSLKSELMILMKVKVK